MEDQLEAYCRRVKALLDCPPKDARRCMTEIRKCAEELRLDNPQLPPAQIVEMLDEPEDAAQSFLETISPIRLRCYRRKRRQFWRGIACITAVIVLLGLYLAQYYIHAPAKITHEEYEALVTQAVPPD